MQWYGKAWSWCYGAGVEGSRGENVMAVYEVELKHMKASQCASFAWYCKDSSALGFLNDGFLLPR